MSENGSRRDALAVGAGSSLVSAKILSDAAWPELTSCASEFVKAAHAARQKK